MSAPANFKAWGRGEVMKFFQGYIFEADELKKIEDLWLHGEILPTVTERKLRDWDIPLGLAVRMITILQQVGIQSGT